MVAGCATMHARPAARCQRRRAAAGRRGSRGDRGGGARRRSRRPRMMTRARCFGRALMAHERGDWDRAWDRWWAVLEGATHHRARSVVGAFADAAAHKLEQLVGEVPGERAQAERLAALDGSKLPPEARLRLLAMRAHYARRLRPRSRSARLRSRARLPRSLVRRRRLRRAAAARPGDARSRPTATAIARGCAPVGLRGCALALEGDKGRAGVLYGVQWFHATRAGRGAHDASRPTRRGASTSTARSRSMRCRPSACRRACAAWSCRWPPAGTAWRSRSPPSVGAPRPISPCWPDAPLEAWTGDALHAPSTDERAIAARAVTAPLARGAAGCRRARRFARSSIIWPAHAAFRAGDGDAGDAALARLGERAPKFAPGPLLAAQLWSDDPSRPSRLARDRGPARARAGAGARSDARSRALQPGAHRAQRRQAARGAGAARRGQAIRCRGGFYFARQQALKQRGWQREADDALAEARRRDPEACPALEADVQRRRELHDVRGALALARQAERVRRRLRRARRSSAHRRAISAAPSREYRRLLALDPMRESWRAGLAETLAQAGDATHAAEELSPAWWRAIRARRTTGASSPTRCSRSAAGGARTQGDRGGAGRDAREPGAAPRARGAVRRARRALPRHHGSLPRRRARRSSPPSSTTRQKPKWDTPAVIVLDRTVTRVFPTGARLTLTHNIIRVQDKDAIDKFGEVRSPPTPTC